MKKITVDLNNEPEERWRLSAVDTVEAARLVDMYVLDLGGYNIRRDAMELYDACGYVPDEYRTEMRGVAAAIDRSYLTVLLANAYYDAIKLAMGSGFACTAFAVDTPAGPVHARNLDWWSGGEDRILSTGSRIIEFVNGAAGTFSVVGWPGYLGALSAIAPGRFSITMNAVSSDDAFQMATPVSFVIREILETASTYDEALRRLTSTSLMCDCLILIAGAKAGEMAVVERTPTQSAVRHAKNGFIAVTNDYRALGKSAREGLIPASCDRFDRVCRLMAGRRDPAPFELLSILSDRDIRMDMTVQQMVMCPATGEITARAS